MIDYTSLFVGIAGLSVVIAICVIAGVFVGHEKGLDAGLLAADRVIEEANKNKKLESVIAAGATLILPSGVSDKLQKVLAIVETLAVDDTERQFIADAREFIKNITTVDDTQPGTALGSPPVSPEPSEPKPSTTPANTTVTAQAPQTVILTPQ